MDAVNLSRYLRNRRSSINTLSPSAQVDVVRCKEKAVKAWSSLENLDNSEKPKKTKERLRERLTEGGHLKKQVTIVNVGGKVFHIPTKCALKYPNTRIGSLVLCQDKATMFKLCDDYCVRKNEFFFDRDPIFFHNICRFYTSGVLCVSQEMCPVSFEEEVAYWGLSLRDTKFCCWLVFEEKLGDVKDRLKVEKELLAELEVKYDDEHFKDMTFGETRQMLWNLVENPYSSTWAKAFTLLSNLCVLISIVAIALDTVEEVHVHKINGNTHMEWVEIFTIIFFTLEYLIRIASTPDLKMFVTGALNFVDLVAILPYFVQIIFESLSGVENIDTRQDLKAMAQFSKLSHVLKVVKLLRIFRILKLARHSTGMKAFGFTLRQCSQQVCCIFLFIGLGIFTFSALLHSVERETEDSPISSIPYAWWWAAVSISTVGYGDVVPVTVLGRFVAFGCISFGIILNGMPISFLFNNFSDYYSKLKAQEYNITSVKRRFGLKTRLRRKCDFCFHPAEEIDPDSPNNS